MLTPKSTPDWLQEVGLDIIRPENALLCKQCHVALTIQPRLVLQHCVNRHGYDPILCQRLTNTLPKLSLTDAPQLKHRPHFSRYDSRLACHSGFACTFCSSSTTSEQLTRRRNACIPGRRHSYEKESRQNNNTNNNNNKYMLPLP
jgi:hypothetical protein